MGVALQGPVHHHVERRLGLCDPAHAVGETCRAESVLSEQVTLATPTEHLGLVHPQVLDQDLGVPGGSVHGLDLADLGPALGRDVHDEGGVGGLGQIGVVLGPGNHDREARPMGVGDEPLVAVDHPLLAVLVGVGADEGRIRPGDLGFGHGEARPGAPGTQPLEVLLLLLVGAPVQQGVHVALVGGLAVEHPWPVVRLRRFGLHHRQLDVTQTHASPLLGHVGKPQSDRLRLVAQCDQLSYVRVAIGVLEIALADPRLCGLDLSLDEVADLPPDPFEFGREAEVDAHCSPGGSAGW